MARKITRREALKRAAAGAGAAALGGAAGCAAPGARAARVEEPEDGGGGEAPPVDRVAVGDGEAGKVEVAAPAPMPPVAKTPVKKHASVAGLKVDPMQEVRAGFIGVGARGPGHVKRLMSLEGVRVVAICDNFAPAAERSIGMCTKAGRPKPASYTEGDYAYREMLAKEELDIVVIATPWRWHTVMCVDAMKAGVHAFTEVPAAVTLDECWQLVEVAEETRMHCMMMENVCYGREELLVLNMCRKGLLGELTHGEAAYIHDLRGQMRHVKRGTGFWRTKHHVTRDGNLYPTHGLGPIAQYMSINRGDRFAYLTSMSSPALGRAAYAKAKFPPDHERNTAKYICGDMNTSLVKTARGRSVMVQHDTTTPRPYNRLNFIQGTKGAFGGYPGRITVEGRGSTHRWQKEKDLDKFHDEFDHPLWKRMGAEAKKSGGHGGMDFLMLWRVIYCLRNGEALDQDVYDAASWSAVSALSELSVANRSSSVEFPDFTRGEWEKTPPLAIVS